MSAEYASSAEDSYSDDSGSAEEDALQEGQARRPLVLTLIVDRSAGARLGVDIETGRQSAGWDGRTLLVRKLQPGGLVEAWNAENPTRSVVPGDRISVVNGVT